MVGAATWKIRRLSCVLVVAFCRTKICPTRNADDWDADIAEVDRIVLTDNGWSGKITGHLANEGAS